MTVANNMAGKQTVGGSETFNSQLAGMSKNQLYDVMSQMKVPLSSFAISFLFVSLFFRESKTKILTLKKIKNVSPVPFLHWHFQTLIEQNRQQAKQILVENPSLTKALFQVPQYSFSLSLYIYSSSFSSSYNMHE